MLSRYLIYLNEKKKVTIYIEKFESNKIRDFEKSLDKLRMYEYFSYNYKFFGMSPRINFSSYRKSINDKNKKHSFIKNDILNK